jgi:hypothetical protein
MKAESVSFLIIVAYFELFIQCLCLTLSCEHKSNLPKRIFMLIESRSSLSNFNTIKKIKPLLHGEKLQQNIIYQNTTIIQNFIHSILEIFPHDRIEWCPEGPLFVINYIDRQPSEKRGASTEVIL